MRGITASSRESRLACGARPAAATTQIATIHPRRRTALVASQCMVGCPPLGGSYSSKIAAAVMPFRLSRRKCDASAPGNEKDLYGSPASRAVAATIAVSAGS